MYSQHFGLAQDPFSIAPDPRYLFMSERHREALAHLLFGVAGRQGGDGGTGGGFVLLTGDIGTGKTTICRCFLEQIPAGCHVAYIFNPKLTVTELLQSICQEFHIDAAHGTQGPPTVKDYIDALNDFLLKSHGAGQSSVLIIDEAQNLTPDVLEQLRLLTNLETNERKLLQIVLIGQPELRTMLAQPELEQLAQRVIARFHLDALTEPETTQYIAHRLAVAGHVGALPFERKALQRIHHLARGVPRRTNLLCGRALLGAWANGLHRVPHTVVDRAAGEVFGPEFVGARSASTRARAYVLGGLFLLAGAALAGFVVAGKQQPARPSPLLADASPHGVALPPAGVASSPVALASVPPALASSYPSLAPSPAAAASAPPPLASPPAAAASVPPSLASTAVTVASASVREQAPPASPVEQAEALLALMPRNINSAWRALAPAWNLAVGAGDPCLGAVALHMRCFSTAKLSIPQLRQLDRPGILTLQQGNDPPVYAVLSGLDEQSAKIRVGASVHSVSLISLGRLWRGDFATYWRAPSSYATPLRDGSSGPAIEHLATRLALIDGLAVPGASANPPVLDAALRERVRAFQRAQGLQADGSAGPLTFMQIDSATGVPGPRLHNEQR